MQSHCTCDNMFVMCDGLQSVGACVECFLSPAAADTAKLILHIFYAPDQPALRTSGFCLMPRQSGH